MVTREKTTRLVFSRAQLGKILIWIGVLIWVPFIAVRAIGYTPSLFWFLPFHLLGVVGGSRLRRKASQDQDLIAKHKTRLQRIGHLLVFAGIMVWIPYFYKKMFTSQFVAVDQFLPYHLAGVLGGVLLLSVNFVRNRLVE